MLQRVSQDFNVSILVGGDGTEIIDAINDENFESTLQEIVENNENFEGTVDSIGEVETSSEIVEVVFKWSFSVWGPTENCTWECGKSKTILTRTIFCIGDSEFGLLSSDETLCVADKPTDEMICPSTADCDIDCTIESSPCTSQCETSAQRTSTVLMEREGNGRSCPKPADCQIGEDDCVDVDECLDEPCGANGRCTDEINSYTCTCINGYSGGRCDIPPATDTSSVSYSVSYNECPTSETKESDTAIITTATSELVGLSSG
eukprot:UN31759